MNLKTLKLEVLDIKKDVSYGDSRMYKVVDETEGVVLRCRQIPFPNCCGITILENVSISHSVKGAEINAVMDNIIDDLYVNDKYSKLIFYTTNNSKEALAFAEYKGCLILDTFVNRRSLNTLIGFEINIEDKSQNDDNQSFKPEDVNSYEFNIEYNDEPIMIDVPDDSLAEVYEAQMARARSRRHRSIETDIPRNKLSQDG